jgi:hypothetical protein
LLAAGGRLGILLRRLTVCVVNWELTHVSTLSVDDDESNEGFRLTAKANGDDVNELSAFKEQVELDSD